MCNVLDLITIHSRERGKRGLKKAVANDSAIPVGICSGELKHSVYTKPCKYGQR
jgi:hypothetical protein